MSSKSSRYSLRTLTFAALMIALTIVFQRIGSITLAPWLRFSLAPVTIILAGLYGGPLIGGIVGGLSDVLGMLIAGQGAFYLGLTVTAIIRGVLPGVIMLLRNGKRNPLTSLYVTLSELVICSLLLQSFWLSQMTGNAYGIIFMQRILTSPVSAVMYYLVLLAVVPALNKVVAPTVTTSISAPSGVKNAGG